MAGKEESSIIVPKEKASVSAAYGVHTMHDLEDLLARYIQYVGFDEGSTCLLHIKESDGFTPGEIDMLHRLEEEGPFK